MSLVQFRIDHKTIVDRQEKLIRYINKNVHLVGGVPNTNCLPIALFALGLVTEEYVLNSTRNKCGTNTNEIKYVTQCAIGDRRGLVFMSYQVGPDTHIEDIFVEIGDHLAVETATVIIIEGHTLELSHAVVFYKNGLGELKIVDPQPDFDGDYDVYPDNSRIAKVTIVVDPSNRGVIERVTPCKIVPMVLDGGKRSTRKRRKAKKSRKRRSN